MPLPLRSWFKMRPPSDLHGLGHVARVMAWACVLTRDTPWFGPVVWAAACHDLRRRDDGDDPDHGFRAGRWVRRKLPFLLSEPPRDLEWIASACDWHVCDDAEAEWDHPVLWWLKDADGLDRVRLYDLDPDYLRHPETLRWVDHAQELHDRTSDSEDVEHIWDTAARLRLPVEPLREFVARQEANLLPEAADI